MTRFKKANKSVYLDFGSATPVDSSVLEKMEPYFAVQFFNPSSLSRASEGVHEEIETVRASVAGHLCARPDQIIFTSGGTEANNLALQGVVRAQRGEIPHIIISAIEHASIREVCKTLTERGEITLTEVGVSPDGVVAPLEVTRAITPMTRLISIQYVNNEIGTIQPVREIARALFKHKKKHANQKAIVFHCDAIQAVSYLDLSVEHLGVDMMTVSAAKIYGPKGSAALYIRDQIQLEPLIIGGGQEHGLRSGTEHVAGIIGLGAALDLVRNNYETERDRLTALRDQFIHDLEKSFPSIRINGSRDRRSANNIHCSFPGISGELLAIELDARGVTCSTKSACSSKASGESHVLVALYGTPRSNALWGSLRFTLGRTTQKRDLDYTIKALAEILRKYERIV